MDGARYVSLQDRLAPDNRPSGFDYLRLVLALLIVVDHSIIVCLGAKAQYALFRGIARPLMTSLVPMFFALSGFLVASSLERSRSIVTFVALRLLRIFPALAIDTLFCALCLGPLLTGQSLNSYLLSIHFYKYFFNMFGDVHFYLPGVFTENPSTAVNAQLWTIPFELKCYLVLTIMAVVGLHRRRAWFIMAAVVVTIATAVYTSVYPFRVLDVWPLLVPTFLFGVGLYLYRERIEWSVRMVVVAVPVTIALLFQASSLMIYAALPLAYVTIWLGLFRPMRVGLIRSGDYSYPIFLYSFPVQQTLFTLVPLARIWWVNLVLATPVAFVFAALSWHLVEKPAQDGRRYIFAFESLFAAPNARHSRTPLRRW
jgi:peptidoglycan/LPS O-acetylase OafA/YrhL